jgi:hypothetical protein
MRFFLTKRFWVRLAIGLAILLALGLILNGLMAWRMESQLEERLAEIRAAGDPASIAELAPGPISDDQNAAAILARVAPRLKEFGKEHGQFFNTPLGKQYEQAQDRGDPPSREQIDAIRAILDKYPDVEQAIANASKCDRFASRLDFSLNHAKFLEQLLKSVQDGRTAVRLVAWRGEVLFAEGKPEEALENAIRALRLARLHEHEPTMVARLVAIAMRSQASEQIYDALAAGGISPALHKELDQELAKHDDPRRIVEVLKAERAVSADWLGQQLDSAGNLRVLAHMFGWPLKSHQVGVLDAMQEFIERASRPMPEILTWLGGRDAPPPTTGHGRLADLLMPAVKAVFEAQARSLAVSRSLRIHNAMRQFVHQHGREATGLAELGLSAEATIDPYTGEPLKLKHTDDGWVIYSVMENGIDDGGNFTKLKDFGVAPPKLRLTE